MEKRLLLVSNIHKFDNKVDDEFCQKSFCFYLEIFFSQMFSSRKAKTGLKTIYLKQLLDWPLPCLYYANACPKKFKGLTSNMTLQLFLLVSLTHLSFYRTIRKL